MRMNQTELLNKTSCKAIIFGLMAIGVSMALYKLMKMPSLHIDEAMLARNFIDRSYLDLVSALDHLQVAPIIFIWIEKLAFDLSSGADVAMRIFPFVLYLFSLILFYLLLDLMFQDNWLKVLGMCMFVFNIYLIDYAIIIKQYMGDVFYTLLVLWILLKPFSNDRKKLNVMIWVGSIGFFFSHIAPIILLAAGIYLLFYVNVPRVDFLKFFGIWGISFLVYYFTFVYQHPLREGMHDFWTTAMGFLPDLTDTKRLYIFFKWKFALIFRDMLSMWTYSKFIAFILGILGIVWLYKIRRIDFIVLLFLPMLVHFLLAAFEVYPFEPRLILYFIPLLLLLILFGIQFVKTSQPEKSRKLVLPIIYILFGFSFWMTFDWKYPGLDPGVKKAMLALREKIEDNHHKVYVASIFGHAFDYYNMLMFDNFYNPPLVISDHKGGFFRGLDQMKSEQGEFYVLSSQLITPQEKLMEAIISQGGEILDSRCFEESCLITMSWK